MSMEIKLQLKYFIFIDTIVLSIYNNISKIKDKLTIKSIEYQTNGGKNEGKIKSMQNIYK